MSSSLADYVNSCRESARSLIPSPIYPSMYYVQFDIPNISSLKVQVSKPDLKNVNDFSNYGNFNIQGVSSLYDGVSVSPINLDISFIELPRLNLENISFNEFKNDISVDDFNVALLPPLISTPSELFNIHQDLELGKYIEVILPNEQNYDIYTNFDFIDINDNEFNNLLSELQLTFSDLNLSDISKNNFNYNIKYNSYLNYTLLKKAYLPYSEKKIIDLNDYMNDMVNIINTLSPEWLLKFSKSKYDLIKHLTLKELNYDKLSVIRSLKLGLFKLKVMNLSSYISSVKNLLDTIYNINNQMVDTLSKLNLLRLEKGKVFINYVKTNENFYKNFVRLESLMREALIVYSKLLSLQVEQQVLSVRKEILDLRKMSALKEFNLLKNNEIILNTKREILQKKNEYITNYDNFLNLYMDIIKQKKDLLIKKTSIYSKILSSEKSVLDAKKDTVNQQIKTENLGIEYFTTYNKALINLYKQYMDLLKDYATIEMSKNYIENKNRELTILFNTNQSKLASVIDSLNLSLEGYSKYLQFEEASSVLSGCINIVNEKIMSYE